MKNLLVVADSEHNANMLYAVGMFATEPFIYLRINGKGHVVMSDPEIDRARAQAAHCRMISLSQCQQKLRRAGAKKTGFAQVIRLILREKRVGKVFVPADFPLELADELRKLDLKVKVKPGSFFPQRERKKAAEVKKISAALIMAEVGLAEGIQALKSSRTGKDGRLIYHNNTLTAERLRAIIDTAITQAAGIPRHTIVSCGKQSCDPYEHGHGPLRANQPIILDVFPRSQKTGYYGDITRTVVKGRASEAVRKLYHAVAEGQKAAFKKIRQGVETSEVYRAANEFFEKEGFKTGRSNGRMHGFFHCIGHGIGLELHEAPSLHATSNGRLRAGHVVAVQPGLYYPEIGGVRLEDVGLVTANNPRNLTQFEKVLEV